MNTRPGVSPEPELFLDLPLSFLDGGTFMSRDACGHQCAVSGAVWRPDGCAFDGVDDAIDLGARISQAAYPLPLTLLAWINKTAGGGAAGNGSDGIVTLERSAKYAGAWLALEAKSGSAYAFSINFGDNTGISAGNRRSKVSAVYDVGEDAWCLVGGVLRGATDMGLFFNGREVAGDYSGTGGQMVWTGSAGKIGAAAANRSYYFKGMIGRVLVYNFALTQSEFQRFYLATKCRRR